MFRKYRLFNLLTASAVVLLCIIFSAVPAFAGDMTALAPLRVETFGLDNGLTLLFQESHEHPLVAIEIIVRTGSLYEQRRQGSGLAHLVEHMLFKGSASRSAAALNDEVRRLGGEINGYTSHQFTGYSLILPAEHMRRGLEILRDMLADPVFDNAELAKEKEVILSEIRMNRDDPERYVSRLFWQYGYAVAPYNLPVIGLEPLFVQLGRQDLIDFHAAWYMPNNMIIGISGDRPVEEARSAVTEVFGSLPMRPFPETVLPTLPVSTSATTFEAMYEGATTYLMLGMPSVELAHPDAPALDVIAALLGDGESSRLYERVVKREKSAYSIDAFNYTPRFRGILGFSAVLERGAIDQCVNAIFAEATRLGRERVPAGELEKVKNKLVSEYVRSRQTVQAKAGEIATDYAYQSDSQFSRRYMEALARVSADDVQRCARRYINRDLLTTVILSPHNAGPADAEKKQAAPQPADMRRSVLPNGVRLLLKPDPTVPVVAVHLILGGGVRYEQEDTNGLFNVLSEMLTRGTRRFSSKQIAEQMAASGGTMAGFSGYNSFGISLEILSKNIDRGLELCLESLLQPAFAPEELALLKSQTVKAIDMRRDDIFLFTMDRMRQTLFSRLAYRFPVVGTKEAVTQITRKQLVDIYQRFCVPSNLVVSVCGDFDPAKVEAVFRKTLGALKSLPVPAASFGEEPMRAERQVVRQQQERKQAVVVYGMPGVSVHHPDRRALELLNNVLTSHGSILYNRIREESGLAYTLGGDAVSGVDGGYFFIYVATAPEHADEIVTLLDEELANVRRQPMPAELISAGQNQEIAQQAIGLQTQAALGFVSGLDELCGLGYDNYRHYAAEIRALTPEKLQEVARAYLGPERSVVVITKK